MSFDADWLALRAPADDAARDTGLLGRVAEVLGTTRRPVVVDLGAGTGATVRAFEALGLGGLRWRLVDHDPDLLAAARARYAGVETREADLGNVVALPFEDAALVTASALLDLCSAAWLEALAARLHADGLPFYAALTYDGTIAWQPAHPDDPAIVAAFNADQRRDKGLGSALGPDAAMAAADIFRSHGLTVVSAPSPWRLGPEDAALQAAFVAGVADAAARAGYSGAGAWAQARRAACAATACTVGHVDVLAWPTAASAQSKTTSESRP